MLLSIIIPHFNSSGTIERLLNSIPMSKNIEIIVVDDKSEASEVLKLQKIILNYENITLILNDTDIKGAGKCRNIGLSSASGDFVLFADSDDYFTDDAFDVVWKSIALNKQHFDVVFYKPTSFDLNSESISNRHERYAELVDNYISHKDSSLLYLFHVPWSKLYRREFLIEKNIFFDEVIESNDVMFSLKSGVNLDSFHVSDNTIYCVTKGVETLTTSKRRKTIKSRLLVEINRYTYCYSNNIPIKKPSLTSIIFSYWRGLEVKTALQLLNDCCVRKIRVFPYGKG